MRNQSAALKKTSESFIDRERDEAAASAAYRHYLDVRDHVLAMMDRQMDGLAEPSKYWQEELAGFDYMLDASPLIIRKLREHSYHITGLHSYAYRHHHAHKAQPYQTKLEALRKLDRKNHFLPESPELGGFGHTIGGQLVNLDTLKFYETLIGMERSGLLGKLSHPAEGKRPVVTEIGAGWGGFAYQLKTLVPNLTYVIIDLPPTLLFSATYLRAMFPDAKTYIYSEDTVDAALANIEQYDFVFLPHYFTESRKLPRLDMAINMISFQEMTAAQVLGYVKWIWENNCPYLYSHNRGKSPHNTQMTNVDTLLNAGYKLHGVSLLPVPYTVLAMPSAKPAAAPPPPQLPLAKSTRKLAKALLRQSVGRSVKQTVKKAIGPSLHDYRHLACTRLDQFRDLPTNNA